MEDAVHQIWPTTLLERRHADPGPLNVALLELFAAHRAADPAPRGPTYASTDQLLARYGDQPAVRGLFEFLSDAVFQAALRANAGAWEELGATGLQVVVVGAWFQVANQGGRHGVHNHGNSSWSGVYYVDCDESAASLAAANGLTRFHGPWLSRLGGAHQDLGSAYLQQSWVDVAPEPGKAVVFPSWLLHEVLPYTGRRDRVIVSFNAQLQARGDAPSRPFGF